MLRKLLFSSTTYTKSRASGWLLASCAFAAGCSGAGGEGTPGETLQQAQNTASSQAEPIDDPSPDLIQLTWKQRGNGSAPVGQLEFDIESRLDENVEVTLTAVGQGPEDDVAVELGKLQISARGKRAHSIPVDQLPVQLVGASVPTIVGAKFTTSDGQERGVTLPMRHVRHERGYRVASLRTPAEEARANAALSPNELANIRAAEGRTVKGGQATALAAVANAPLPRLISQLPLDRAALAALNPIHFPENDSDEQVEKAGNYNICVKLPYMYKDALSGGDYLLAGYTPSTIGYTKARYALAKLVAPNGGIVIGYLNSDGCTGDLYHTNGAYTVHVAPIVDRGGSDDMRFHIFDTEANYNSETYGTWVMNYNISGGGGTKRLNASGLLQVSNATVTAIRTVEGNTNAWRGGTTYILTDAGCDIGNGEPITACAEPGEEGRILLNYRSDLKFVISHEIGHRVQDRLFGMQRANYNEDSPLQLACRCTHVTSSNRAHCLQSRETDGAAQREGFAQFFAAKSFNKTTESDCSFLYYKEFKLPSGTVMNPPVYIQCNAQYAWMNNQCPVSESGHGVELDWMGFLWWLKAYEGYTWGDFENIYEGACNGTCNTNDEPSWSALQSSVSSVFGSSSSELDDWNTYGNLFGTAN